MKEKINQDSLADADSELIEHSDCKTEKPSSSMENEKAEISAQTIVEMNDNEEIEADIKNNNVEDDRDKDDAIEDKQDERPKMTFMQKIFPVTIRAKVYKRVYWSLLFISMISAVIAFFYYRIDGIFMPSQVKMLIVDYNEQPLSQVKIKINGREAYTTDQSGKIMFEIGNGIYSLEFEVDNYEKLMQKIEVQRGNNEIRISMKPNSIGDLKIHFSPNEGAIDATDFKVVFDGKEYQIDKGGDLLINDYKVGKYKLAITSPYYYDFESEVEIKPGINDIGEVLLNKAKDIEFVIIDWLSQQPLKGVKISIDGIDKETDENGKVTFLNLTNNLDNLQIASILQGYLAKNVTLEVTEETKLEQIELVRAGKIIYTSKRLGNTNIYTANYDGSDEKMITDNKGDAKYPTKIPGANTIRFLSNRDGVKNTYGYAIDLVYSVPLNGGKITKITKSNYPETEYIGEYNLISLKRAFSTTLQNPETNEYYSNLYIGNIDGTASELILEGQYTYQRLIANSGKYLLYTMNDEDNRVYLFDLNKKTSTKINTTGEYAYAMGFSPNEKTVLVASQEADGSDLYIYEIASAKISRITNSSALELAPKYFNEDTIYYLSERDGNMDIYSINTKSKKEERITNLGNVIEFNIEENGILSFLSNNTLYLIDAQNPKQIKKAINQVSPINPSWGD